MGWLSYLAATSAQNGVKTLEGRIKELEDRILILEYEVRSLKKRESSNNY